MPRKQFIFSSTLPDDENLRNRVMETHYYIICVPHDLRISDRNPFTHFLCPKVGTKKWALVYVEPIPIVVWLVVAVAESIVPLLGLLPKCEIHWQIMTQS